ncbi:variant erythrocyte surface antigen-1 family protein [Babesia divergens]|uniref:Variant erythrocyte surface antigen-1 family protein n=1 Tax=Babesia divergens TaxID=32595 RepID=A0AAD9GB66_BABDI|nr:variant erythrocyte surface antigen-1 family protein [Babesia divergens]
MYYTDVFVGTNNIDNLKNALIAELNGSGLNDDLNALASGLGFLAGLPACLCKTKKSVEEGLKKIYEELKTSLISCKDFKLNCDSCDSKLYPCKCCVIQSINKVKECPCLKGNKTCHCDGKDVSCAKVLAGLEACLHLQCLQSDMNEICECNDFEQCCKSGTCTQASVGSGGSCTFCQDLKSGKSVPTTGLGLLRPSPIRLAERLEKFFDSGPGPKNDCSCTCGSGKNESCCCLACQSCSSQHCSCSSSGSSGQCSCAQALQSQGCPRLTFCQTINSIKVSSGSSDMTCCSKGADCHCVSDSTSGSNSNCSGDCCKEHNKQSVKCMIRRLVSYFKDLKSDTSNKGCFKNCCELMCVLKTCDFLQLFYDRRNLNECSKCKSGGSGCSSSGGCCLGTISGCTEKDCCKDCEDCCAVKFSRALEELRFAGPCGQDLWRTLDSFLNFCCKVFYAKVKDIQTTLQDRNSGHAKNCKCKSGTCTCSPSSGCQGCTAVLKELRDNHKDLLGLMTRGYSSAYSEASWDSLTSSISGSGPCCGSSSPSCGCPSNCSSGSSCPSQCCPDCPQRKAAKIFLGMLPCLYYGLKILYDRCKYNSGFAGWQYISVYSDGKPSSDLAKFLFAWGFQTIESSGSSTIHMNPLLQAMVLPVLLENLFTPKSNGILKNLYENCKIYFTSFSSRSISSLPSGSTPKSPSDPSTVRSMLLWLYGLRFQKGFSDLVLYCKSLCSPFGNSFHPDDFCYYIHTCSFILPVSIISFIETSDSALSLISSSSDWKDFSYPEDLSSLFEKLCEYARKIFVALAFLYYQCERVGSQAGWRYCYYGKNCKPAVNSSSSSLSSSGSSSGSDCSCKYKNIYLCTNSGQNTDIHSKHCAQTGGCLGFGSGSTCKDNNHNKVNGKSQGKSCSNPCPHPLQRFLTATSDSETYPFGLSDIVPMGFESSNLSSTARDGWSRYAVLKAFCKDGFYPLSRLVQFVLCVSRYPPETLGELYAFFMKFVESSVFRDHFASYVDGEPGRFLGNSLKGAVQGLYGAKDSHKGSGGSSHQDPSKTPADLQSLYNCHPKKDSDATCGQYLHPLTYNAYNNNIFIDDFLDTYLSWVCYSAEDFKKKLEEFHHEASTKSLKCCLSSSCKIVECPCAHPFLYSYGFTFWSPNSLNCETHGSGNGKHNSTSDPNCTRKTCKDFLDQLSLVIQGSPLQTLLTVIDNFLWHIRLPFIYAFLYIWILVISYFYYVQFYKLDLLHIDSHLHLPRSFKILPSTLFSDASSKLKDLSYFTL